MNKQDLLPSQVVIDSVLKYSKTMPGLDHAAVMNKTLIIATRNHRGEYISLSVHVEFDGEPSDDMPPRFVLKQIGSTVWKLSPSILSPVLHAFITIVDVPEDVDWGKS